MRKTEWVVRVYEGGDEIEGLLQKHLNQWSHDYDVELVKSHAFLNRVGVPILIAIIKRTRKEV